MNFAITSFKSNTSFLGRHRMYSKEALDKIFLPLLENKNITKDEFVKINSGISCKVINNWFKETFGLTFGKYFEKRTGENLLKEINDYYESGLSDNEITKLLYKKDSSIVYKLKKFGYLISKKELYKQFNNKIPKLLEAGYSMSRCSEELGVDIKTVRYWILQHKKDGFKLLAHGNSYIKSHCPNKTYAEFKAEFVKFFEKGGTINDAIEEFKKSRSAIYSWLRKFNIKPDKKRIRERIEQDIPELINSKLNLSALSHKYGVPKGTIARYIKNLTGQNYRDLKTI